MEAYTLEKVQNRQKGYVKVGQLIIGKDCAKFDSNTIVIFGGGSFDHASRGHPATPKKGLFNAMKKYCRVRLSGEYRTSKRCSNCEHVLEQSRFWRVKQCKNCFTFWHRDVNAARNIRYTWIYRNEFRVNPDPFRWLPRQQQQQSN